jgi:hypothetical protein
MCPCSSFVPEGYERPTMGVRARWHEMVEALAELEACTIATMAPRCAAHHSKRLGRKSASARRRRCESPHFTSPGEARPEDAAHQARRDDDLSNTALDSGGHGSPVEEA